MPPLFDSIIISSSVWDSWRQRATGPWSPGWWHLSRKKDQGGTKTHLWKNHYKKGYQLWSEQCGRREALKGPVFSSNRCVYLYFFCVGWIFSDEFPKNAFSSRLATKFKFNMFPMFVVDLLHEVELGVWRSLFIHLLRILECISPTLTHKLDERFVSSSSSSLNHDTHYFKSYREVPTFGRDTIRKFSSNCSEMKRLAARDFEDLLQVNSTSQRSMKILLIHVSSIYSVPYRCLRVFYQCNITRTWSLCSSIWATGTPLQNWECTQKSLWVLWMK